MMMLRLLVLMDYLLRLEIMGSYLPLLMEYRGLKEPLVQQKISMESPTETVHSSRLEIMEPSLLLQMVPLGLQ